MSIFNKTFLDCVKHDGIVSVATSSPDNKAISLIPGTNILSLPKMEKF